MAFAVWLRGQSSGFSGQLKWCAASDSNRNCLPPEGSASYRWATGAYWCPRPALLRPPTPYRGVALLNELRGRRHCRDHVETLSWTFARNEMWRRSKFRRAIKRLANTKHGHERGQSWGRSFLRNVPSPANPCASFTGRRAHLDKRHPFPLLGARCRPRTRDLRCTKAALYHLS